MYNLRWIAAAAVIIGLFIFGFLRWNAMKPSDGYLVVNFYSSPSKVYSPKGEFLLTLPGIYFTPISGGVGYLDSNGVSLVNNKMEVIWKRPEYVSHHVISLDDQENIFFPSYRILKKGKIIIRVNMIIGLNREGKTIFSWDEEEHRAEMLHETDVPKEADVTYSEKNEWTHKYLNINGVTVIPENDLSAIDSRFRKGNLLVTEEKEHIFIIDRDTGQLTFSYNTRKLLGTEGIHTAQVLKNGHILLFNNMTNYHGDTGVSRVVEIDPLEFEIVWQYCTPPPNDFYNLRYAGVFITDTGSMLISDARKGRAFEINSKHEIIWEWINPEKGPEQNPNPIFHAKKFSAEVVEPFINVN